MYESGREYSKYHLPKGKANKGKCYEREERDSNNIPVSHKPLNKFIKDQNRELRNFIEETTEYETSQPASAIFEDDSETNDEMEQTEYIDDVEFDYDSDEEVLEVEENV